MILFFDAKLKFLTEIAREDVLEAETDEKLGGLIQAQITVRFGVFPKEASYFGTMDGENLSLYKITKEETADQSVALQGIHAFFDDLCGYVIRDKRPSSQSATFMLDSILEGTGWKAVVNVSGVRSTNFYHKSVLDCFYEIMDLFHVQFRPVIHMQKNQVLERTVLVQEHISKDYGKWFEYGDSLLKVKAEEDHASIATAFIGYGKGEQTDAGGYGRKLTFRDVEWSKASGDPLDKPLGQDFLEFPEATKTYGYLGEIPRTAMVEFSQVEDPNELLQQTYETGLENIRPKLQLQASAIAEERVELGETCAIVRGDINIRYKTTVFHIKTDLLTGVQDFEFGDSILVSQSEQLKALSQAVSEEREQYSLGMDAFIEKVQESLTDQWRNDDGFNYELKAGNPYHLPAGFYSFDQAIDQEPSEVVGISAGKLVIANRKTPDGDWDFHTFGTGDGFTADLIQTGVLQGGDVELNLETGVLKIGDDLYYSTEDGLILGESAKEQLKGEKGEKGDPGAPGEDGASIVRVFLQYATPGEGADASTAPVSGWSESPPEDPLATIWRRFGMQDSAGFVHYTEPEKLTTDQIDLALEQGKTDVLSQVMNAGFASQAYADGVVSDAEDAILERYENRLAAEIQNVNADFETKLLGVRQEMDSRLADQESYLWVDGGNLYLGRKGGDVALVISPEEMSFRVLNQKTGTFNSERLIVENADAQALRIVNPEGEAIFQWVTRRMPDGYHLSLEYVGF